MNTTWTWEQLLIIGGFLVEVDSDLKIKVCRDNAENERFLFQLLNDCKLKGYDLSGEPPTFAIWHELLVKYGGRPSEQIYRTEQLVLVELDVHMLGVIRQLNRLGISTYCSCSGHGMTPPKLYIMEQEQRQCVKHMVSLLGYEAIFSGANSIEVKIEESLLFNLAIDLSRLAHLNTNAVESLKLEKRTDVLDALLAIPGRSGEEGLIRNFLIEELKPLVDTLNVDNAGNILAGKVYGKGETVLLSAHMDVVSSDIDPTKTITKHAYIWKRESGILGADDRAGIAIIINILKELKASEFKGTLKILFTVEEECGQNGAEAVEVDFFNDVYCAISLDRRNALDVVTHSASRQYCSENFGQFFERQSRFYHNKGERYKVVRGGVSDLRVWSALGIESVNLSIGYYEEHTQHEYLNILEWQRTLEFTKRCLERLEKVSKERRNDARGLREIARV